jgi:NCAIR mutase (PurE)-related protein
LDSLIEEELVRQKAESAGYVVDDEIKRRVNEDYELAIKEYAEMLKLQAGEDADPDTDFEQQARQELQEYITASGQTEEEYLEFLGKYLAIQDYLDEMTTDVEVEDKEVEEFYQTELEFQTKVRLWQLSTLQ